MRRGWERDSTWWCSERWTATGEAHAQLIEGARHRPTPHRTPEAERRCRRSDRGLLGSGSGPRLRPGELQTAPHGHRPEQLLVRHGGARLGPGARLKISICSRARYEKQFGTEAAFRISAAHLLWGCVAMVFRSGPGPSLSRPISLWS